MDIVNCFSHLQLHLLGEEWMQQVWDSDFTEFDEFPNEYEEFVMENDVVNILEMIVQLLRSSVGRTDDCSDPAGPTKGNISVSWELLVENKVEHRHLLSLLGHFINNGQKKSEDVKALELCFKSCSVYYLLLTIPGCDAFFVFQPSVYEKALKTLNICNMLTEAKPSKQSRGRKKASNEDDEEDCDEEGNGVSFVSLTVQAKAHIRKCLCIILKDMSLMMMRYPLKTEDTLEKTVTQLISHTRLVSNLQISDFDTVKVNGDISSFVSNSYNLLKVLCLSFHGKTEVTVKLILYHLLPNVLMAGDFVKDITMHNLNLIRLQTEKFVLHLLKSLEEDSYQGICLFVQHLCARVTDRADYRLKVSQSIVSLLEALPSEPYFHTIKWLLRFAHDVKASHRLFAVEVISKLLYEDERPNDLVGSVSHTSNNSVSPHHEEEQNEDESEGPDPIMNNSLQPERDVASHKYLLGVLFSRCHDQSGTVRTKALSTLTDCLRSNNRLIMELMKGIFVTPYEDNDLIENDSIVERGFLNTKIFLDSLDKPQHLQADPLPGGKAVVIEMLKLVEDNKVFVRKAAFSFLEYVMRLNRKWLNEKLLKVICDHVRDPALLIKKQLIQSLTDLLLLYPEDARLATYYIEAVLPQISHPELKVQEKVLEALENSILQQLVPFKNLSSNLSYLPWKLLEVIIDLKKNKFFQIVCSLWSKNKTFSKNIVNLIQSHIETKHNVAAWLFLSCVAPYIPIKAPHFIVNYYQENLTNSEKTTRYAVVKALDVLGSAWKYLPEEEQDSICTELLQSVEHMGLSTTLIGPVLDVVLLITLGRASSDKEGQEIVMVWSKRILEKTEEYFQQHSPCRNDNKRVNMEEFMRNLVTLGDVAQLCPGKVPINVAIILTGILFPEKLHDPVKWSVPGLQALTVIALGKMCLQNETLAKRIIPALGLLLAESKHEAVKVNVIYTLSDMCIRFTAIVEPLLPEMCVCLKDNNDTVRHRTVTVFVRLLQQDFLKLRGALLFHMMSMLVDPVQNIAQLANYFMTQCVVTRNKSIMYQNIVESIFYYNKYENHPVYSKVKLSIQEAHLFNMAGAENEAKRRTLYRFMCEHMTDEHRMQAVHKICVDILGGVSNETVSLDEKGESVLHDAFFVLSCEEICLHSLRTQSEEEPATDDAERVTAAVNTAKKNIISQCVKKQVVEIIIPIIVQLKGKLQAIMSPLLTNLMSYLRGILKDYKNEIEEIFAEDKTMAEEILFDMKRFEEEEKNRTQSQDSDEEDGGEVDHMRPLLVELATNHLRKSIRHGNSQNSSQAQSIGSLGPNDQASPSTVVSEGRNCTDGSPSETNKNSKESSQTESNSQPAESLPGDEQSSCHARQSSITRCSADSLRSRSCTPTRRTSRNSQKRIYDETIDDAPLDEVNASQPGSTSNSAIGSESSRRRSLRKVSTDSNTESHTSENQVLDNVRARSRTPTHQSASRDSQKHNFNEALFSCDTTPSTSSRHRTASGSESLRRQNSRAASTDSNPGSPSNHSLVKVEQINGTDAVNGFPRKQSARQRSKRTASGRNTGGPSP